VIAAAWIEPCPAAGTHVLAFQVLSDGQLGSTRATDHSILVPFDLRPQFNIVASQRIVTILASVVRPTALHFDRDNIQLAVVMAAARFRIEIYSKNSWAHFVFHSSY